MVSGHGPGRAVGGRGVPSQEKRHVAIGATKSVSGVVARLVRRNRRQHETTRFPNLEVARAIRYCLDGRVVAISISASTLAHANQAQDAAG